MLVILLHNAYLQNGPEYPGEQVQVSGAIQVPWPLQTFVLLLVVPLQIVLSQNVPMYPGEQVQLSGEVQIP